MKKAHEITIRLDDDEKNNLVSLAEKMDARTVCGPACGKPSAQVLVQMIARGRLNVVDPLAQKNRFWLNFKYPPAWWTGGESGLMLINDAVSASKKTKAQLVEAGLIDEGDHLRAKWKTWKVKKKNKNWAFAEGMSLADALKTSGLTADELTASGYYVDVDANENEILLKQP